MAERVLLVCDECGRPAVETVTFKTASGNRQKDYCSEHLQALLQGSRTPKRGRKPAALAGSTPARRATRKKPARKTARKKTTAAKRSAA